MRTSYCPKNYRELASTVVGERGTPGRQYSILDVVISKRNATEDLFRCHIVESWGSHQGHHEEHGRKEVVGRSKSLEGAATLAKDLAIDAGMDDSMLAQALSLASNEAAEELYRPGPNDVLATVDDADFNDCTAQGFKWELYGDGHVAATYHSRWQGSTNGARWSSEPGTIDVDEIGEGEDRNAEAMLTAFANEHKDCDFDEEDGWRKTSNGHTVK